MVERIAIFMRNGEGLTEDEFLKGYDANRYEKPAVTVDMLVFSTGGRSDYEICDFSQKNLRLLMIRRGNHPHMGKWALPGGFVEMDESLEDAAMRELEEETGLSGIFMHQLHTWGDVGRDPRMRVISTSYMAVVDEVLLDPKAGDDADDARWFSVSCMPSRETITEMDGVCTLERIFSLELESGNERAYASVKVSRTVGKGGKNTRVDREVLLSEGIAFDHAKIIVYAIEKLVKRWGCDSI